MQEQTPDNISVVVSEETNVEAQNSSITAINQLFAYDDNIVRCEIIDDEPWFVARDICNILEITNVSQATARLDDDEKGVYQTYTLGGKQEMSIINESGLYNLVLRSDKPEAKNFRKWLIKEVIPSIRKTGSYSQNKNMVSISISDAVLLINAVNNLKSAHRFSNLLQYNVVQKVNPLMEEIKEIYETIANIIPSVKIGDYELKSSPNTVVVKSKKVWE